MRDETQDPFSEIVTSLKGTRIEETQSPQAVETGGAEVTGAATDGAPGATKLYGTSKPHRHRIAIQIISDSSDASK